MLANLKAIYVERNDAPSLTWVMRLRSRIPDVAPQERQQLAALLAGQGRYREAADELEALAEISPDDEAALLRREAISQLSRLN